MKITFVLPGPAREPVGGYKVVYEYANYFVSQGHSITVIQTSKPDKKTPWYLYPLRFFRYLQFYLDGSYHPKRWFALNSDVMIKWVFSLDGKNIPNADIIIATSWRSAEWVAEYPRLKGERYYLIQHFESWDGDEQRTLNTFQLPLRKVVISQWLKELIVQQGGDATVIPNGLDHSLFGVDLPIESRSNQTIMMLYHELEWKGTHEGISALNTLKQKYPNISAILFSTYARSDKVPSWINYVQLPTQSKLRELYNSSSIFIAPSWSEGWGLPPCEAMMCGCAVVATDIDGHQEFAFDNDTALLVPAQSADSIVERVSQLIDDDQLRYRIAYRGNQFVQEFTWEASGKSFLKMLEESN